MALSRTWGSSKGGKTVGQMDEIMTVMAAVAKYREDRTIPTNPQKIDKLAKELLDRDMFDDVGIAWKRISEYEREVHGGEWPKRI